MWKSSSNKGIFVFSLKKLTFQIFLSSFANSCLALSFKQHLKKVEILMRLEVLLTKKDENDSLIYKKIWLSALLKRKIQ
jgi:hypothetical protein